MRWMSFPDGDKLRLLRDGTRPVRSNFAGPWVHYILTIEQSIRSMRSGKQRNEWVDEVTAKGEVVERVWPPQEHPPSP